MTRLTSRSTLSSSSSDESAEHLARRLRGGALARGEAVLVGNRGGVVEWASAAWARLTGFSLADTVDKPIGHFLARAGIAVELVDFVAQEYLEGRDARVAVVFETPDGRTLDVHLEVEPIHGATGELERFIAVARDVTRALRRTVPRPATTIAPPVAPGVVASSDRCDVSRAARRALCSVGTDVSHGRSLDFVLDVELEDALPAAALAADRLEEMIRSLLIAATTGAPDDLATPRFLTLLSGRLEPGRSHHSQAYPMPLRSTARLAGEHVFVEIHDSGPPLSPEVLARIADGRARGDDATPYASRERRLRDACLTCQASGGALLLDASPGCGTLMLLVLPAAAAEVAAGSTTSAPQGHASRGHAPHAGAWQPRATGVSTG